MPLDTYEIVVNENSMYYQGKRTFNMFSEVHKDYAFECSVALNPKNLCDFSLQLFDLDNG